MVSFKGIDHESSNVFHRNVDDTSMPTNDIPTIVENPSSHDDDE